VRTFVAERLASPRKGSASRRAAVLRGLSEAESEQQQLVSAANKTLTGCEPPQLVASFE